MARRDTNNRIVPEAVKNIQLQPVTTITNQRQEFRPDLEDAAKTQSLYASLADLSKGVMNLNTVVRLQSQDNAMAAYAKTEDKNKKDWAEVSKNIDGMAKFNPYNKNAYNKLLSADIVRKYTNNLYADPDLKYRTPEEVDNLIANNQQDMIEEISKLGLREKDYADYLIQYSNKGYELKQKYVAAHAEVEMDMTNNKIQDTYQYYLLTNGEEGFTSTLDAVVAEGNMLGRTDISNAENVLGTVQRAIVSNPTKYTTSFVLSQLKNYQVNGKPLTEIVPNMEEKVIKLMKEAKRADYEDRFVDYQNHELDMKIATQGAMRDLYKFSQENPNANLNDMSNYAKQLISDYGLEEDGFSFLQLTAHNKSMLQNLKEVESNPDVLQDFAAKAARGLLTGEEVDTAIMNKQVNWRDGLQFIDRINREAKAEVKDVEQDFKEFEKKLDTKNGIYGQTLRKDKKELKKIEDQKNQITIALNEGRITPDVAKKQLSNLEKIAKAKAKRQETKISNDSFLLNANYIKTQEAPQYTPKADKALKQLGLLRGKLGQKENINITSQPQASRIINGKETGKHIGYDLGATTNTNVHSAPMAGIVLYSGYLSDFGNFVVIKYDNGTYTRIGHLSTPTKNLQGKRIAPNEYIGKAGSTGRSTGVHVHIDFWDKDRTVISAETFAKGMK